MYVEWTKNLQDPEKKAKFEEQVYNAKDVLARLHKILGDYEDMLDRTETNIKIYDTPNWSERQAHKNGNREMLRFLKKLIDLDHQKEHKNDRESPGR